MGPSAKRFFVKFATLAVFMSLSIARPDQSLAQTDLPKLPSPGSTSISREQQQQLGFQAAGEVYKQMPVLPDDRGVAGIRVTTV